MLMLVFFCYMFSSSDTQPSSNYRHREAACCISGNRESGRELLEFYITQVLGSENSLAILTHQGRLPGGGMWQDFMGPLEKQKDWAEDWAYFKIIWFLFLLS